ncbi:MAG: phenylalanine--tRNA ligase subunit beta, partial [Christensenellaceae bacterium]|nr:phenylalanine--tRNA ligase subunit beta [Christensenellaceae bacterium]
MYISINWIKDFVNLDGISDEELVKRFTLSTAEVDDVIVKGKDISNVVVGKILSVDKHPISQKLHVLKVDGGDKIYDVVCGAPNVKEGIKVPFAKTGAQVGTKIIEAAMVAEVMSEGMCMSEKELGISEDNTGLMIIEEDFEVGADIKSVYPIDDLIFEVDNKSLTNRPDLWGHYGMAREFAAIFGRTLLPLPTATPKYTGDTKIPVEIERSGLCFRYCALKFKDVVRKVSPTLMRIRLYYSGMRAINFLADLTNYIMLEIGQPLHAFDANKIKDISVGTPVEAIDFVTLDKSVRKCDQNTLLIKSGGEPVAIAGIMGGLDSEIAEGTTSVILEAATFDATVIRKASSRLGLRSDASQRYEKSLDPELTMTAVGRFTFLLATYCPEATPDSLVSDVYVKRYPKLKITFDKAYIDRYTGIDIPLDRITKTLVSLGFSPVRKGNNFEVGV